MLSVPVSEFCCEDCCFRQKAIPLGGRSWAGLDAALDLPPALWGEARQITSDPAPKSPVPEICIMVPPCPLGY